MCGCMLSRFFSCMNNHKNCWSGYCPPVLTSFFFFLPTWEEDGSWFYRDHAGLLRQVSVSGMTRHNCRCDAHQHTIWSPQQLGRRRACEYTTIILAFSHGSIWHGSLKHTFIAFSRKRTKNSGVCMCVCVRMGSCRGGGVKEEVTLIIGPFFFPAWHSSLSTVEKIQHVLLSEKGNVNIQESIFGRMWGGSGWRRRGAAKRSQRQTMGVVLGPMWERSAPEG